MKTVILLICLLFVLSSYSYQLGEGDQVSIISNSTNHTAVVDVNSLSVWIVKHVFKVPAFSNLVVNILDNSIKDQQIKNFVSALSNTLTTVGFVVVFLLCTILLLITIIVIAVLQCCCSSCSDPKMSYGTGHKLSSKTLIFFVLFSIILVCSCCIFYYVALSKNGGEISQSFNNPYHHFNVIFADMGKNLAAVHKLNVTNITLPKFFVEMNKSVFEYETSVQSQFVKDFTTTGYYIPIISLVVIIIFCILGIILGFTEKRIMLGLVAAFFFIFFFVFIVLSISGGTSALVLSDVCVSGIDTQVTTVVNTLKEGNDTCIPETLKHYLFCSPINHTKCQVWEKITFDIENTVEDLEIKYNETHDQKINQTITILENLLKNINNLENCNNTKSFYASITNSACGPFTTNLILSSIMTETLSGLSFLFLMTFFYSLYRLGENIPENEGYEKVSRGKDDEITLNSRSRTSSYSRTNSRVRGNSSINYDTARTYKKSCGSVGCFFYTVLIIAFWGSLVFITGYAVIFGGKNESISRI